MNGVWVMLAEFGTGAISEGRGLGEGDVREAPGRAREAGGDCVWGRKVI
jgi:hypothetical protein